MPELILWCGFAGAWLLVAGPVYQATIELREEEFERERFEETAHSIAPPDPVSAWWWLVPPLHLYLSRRRKERWGDQLLVALPDEDYEALSSFMAKARGWLLVGGGGLLLAVKETWELVESHDWPAWLFWLLVVVMALLALGNAAYQSAREGRAADVRAKVRAADRPAAQ